MLSTLKQHPKGLFLLFFVEMWERFSYYGMRALIVLYVIQNLSYSTQTAGNIYGFYTGFVYLTPMLGGYLADKYFGQRRCITAGAIFMSAGLFLLAFGGKALFFASLFLMIVANGLFKSNISAILGLLYGKDNSKKDSAFTIFYMGINLGALLSPIICGTLAVKYGFEWGFASAGVGMLIGLCCYKIFENKLLGNNGLNSANKSIENIENIEAFENQKQQADRFISLLVLMLFTIPFWVCFEQAGSSLTLFAQYQTNRSFCGYKIPTEYFQALNPFFIILLAPLLSIIWEKLRAKNKEPDSVEKFVFAYFLMFLSYILLTIAGYKSTFTQVSPLWLVIGYFGMTLSELCLSPIGLSLVSKLAPKRFLSLTMGCWFLTSFVGNLFAGFWGGKYESLSIINLFGSLALLAIVTFTLLVIFIPYLKKSLR